MALQHFHGYASSNGYASSKKLGSGAALRHDDSSDPDVHGTDVGGHVCMIQIWSCVHMLHNNNVGTWQGMANVCLP
jgi:hypothetical protein